MIGAIPNPAKSFQVDHPIAEVKEAIEHIPLFTTQYSMFKASPMINEYTFAVSEFLSLGAYININCFAVSDTKTDIKMEVRRKVGTFNQHHEISLADNHLRQMTELFITSFGSPVEGRRSQALKAQENNPAGLNSGNPMTPKESFKVFSVVALVLVLGVALWYFFLRKLF